MRTPTRQEELVTDIERAMAVVVHEASAILRKEGKEEGNKGGYFCLYGKDPAPILIRRYGIIEKIEDALDRLGYTQEKAGRIIERFEVSSWQSRNPSVGRYGGAIRVAGKTLSFSGFPELMDEAVCLVVAVRVRLITVERALRIVKISGNAYFEQLRQAVAARETSKR